MFTLSNFYRSKEWESLRSQLRIERVNDDGDIICHYCHKPIIKAYDCIAHHVVPLTESNVNDYSISLNPDNLVLVHHNCHNKIHSKGFKCKRVYIVYGSPCSGKSYYVDSVAGDNDLKVLGSWYSHIGAREGTKIKVEWISPTDIVLSVLT
jgi:hypothetical protein